MADFSGSGSTTRTGSVILCEPPKDCRDPNVNRWYCMRGHADDDVPAVPGVCPLKKCQRADVQAVSQ